jgi:hypothetical protein
VPHMDAQGPAESGAASTYACNTCGVLPRTCFQPSSLRKSLHKCRACMTERNKRYYRDRKEVFTCARVRRREKCQLDPGVLRHILQLHGGRCIVTGEESDALTLVRIDASRPLGLDNAAPVHSRVASAFNYVLPAALHGMWREACVG